MIQENQLNYSDIRDYNKDVTRRCEAILEETKVAMKINDSIMESKEEEIDEVCTPYVIVLSEHSNMVEPEKYDFSGCTWLEEVPIFCSRTAAKLAIDILLRNYNWTQNRFEDPVHQNGYRKNNY